MATQPTLIVTGSFKANLCGRNVTGNSEWRFTESLSLANWYPPGASPPGESGPSGMLAVDGPLGSTLPDVRGWGLQGYIYANGYVFSSTFNLLLARPSVFAWAVSAGASDAAAYLPPVWSSDIRTGEFILVGSNVYHEDGSGPVIKVFTTGVSIGSGAGLSLANGAVVNILLTSNTPSSDNGIWQLTGTSNPNTPTWARPPDWADYLAKFHTGSSGSNSRVEIYTQTATSTGGGNTYANPALLDSIWSLFTDDGSTWFRYDIDTPGGTIGNIPSYAPGQYVYGNDGNIYTPTTTTDRNTPDPVAVNISPNPWTSASYDGTAADCGEMSVSVGAKIGVSINQTTLYNGTVVDIYMSAQGDDDGTLVASGVPAYTNPSGFFNGAPIGNYVDFDIWMRGDGLQNILDGNPVRASAYFGNIPAPGSYALFGDARWTFNVTGTYPNYTSADFTSAVQGYLSAAYGACTVDRGYVIGAGGMVIAIKSLTINLFAQMSSGGAFYPVGDVNGNLGNSLAAYKNTYMFLGGGRLSVSNGGTTHTSTRALSSNPTLGQVNEVMQELIGSGLIGGANVRKTGDYFTATITSSYPFPVLSGYSVLLRSPWRFVVHFAEGLWDSYYPTRGIAPVSPFAHPGSPVNSGLPAGYGLKGGVRTVTYTGNNTFNFPPFPPSFYTSTISSSAQVTGDLGFQITCWIGSYSGGGGGTNINAAGSDMSFDVYKRPVMAVDAGSGTTEIAYTPDSGESWLTHAGPSGSMPSIAVDGQSNTFVMAVNNGGSVHTYINPNGDWSSTTGLVTGGVVSGESGLIAMEPNNPAHLLLASIDGGGALNVSESFDGGRTYTALSTVESSGMDPTRGFAGRVRWIGSRPYVVYSVDTQITFASSTDGGQTWTKATVVSGDTYTRVAADTVGGFVMVYARDSGGVWHLWRGGDLVSWDEVISPTIPQPPTDADVAFGQWPLSNVLLISGSNVA